MHHFNIIILALLGAIGRLFGPKSVDPDKKRRVLRKGSWLVPVHPISWKKQGRAKKTLQVSWKTTLDRRICGILGWACMNVRGVFALHLGDAEDEGEALTQLAELLRHIRLLGWTPIGLKETWWRHWQTTLETTTHGRAPRMIVVAMPGAMTRLQALLGLEFGKNFGSLLSKTPEKLSSYLSSPVVEGVFAEATVSVWPSIGRSFDGSGFWAADSESFMRFNEALVTEGYPPLKIGDGLQIRGRCLAKKNILGQIMSGKLDMNAIKGCIWACPSWFIRLARKALEDRTGMSFGKSGDILTTTDLAKKSEPGLHLAKVLLHDSSWTKQLHVIRIGRQIMTRWFRQDHCFKAQEMCLKQMRRLAYAIRAAMIGDVNPLLHYCRKIDFTAIEGSARFSGALDWIRALRNIPAANNYSGGRVEIMLRRLIREAYGISVKGWSTYAVPGFAYEVLMGEPLPEGTVILPRIWRQKLGDHVVAFRNPCLWKYGAGIFRAYATKEWFFRGAAFGYGCLTEATFGKDYDGDTDEIVSSSFFTEDPQKTWNEFWAMARNSEQVKLFLENPSACPKRLTSPKKYEGEAVLQGLEAAATGAKIGLVDNSISTLNYLGSEIQAWQAAFCQSVLDAMKHEGDSLPSPEKFDEEIYELLLRSSGSWNRMKLYMTAKSVKEQNTWTNLSEQAEKAVVEVAENGPSRGNRFMAAVTEILMDLFATVKEVPLPKRVKLIATRPCQRPNDFLSCLSGLDCLNRFTVTDKGSLFSEFFSFFNEKKEEDETTLTAAVEVVKTRMFLVAEWIRALRLYHQAGFNWRKMCSANNGGTDMLVGLVKELGGTDKDVAKLRFTDRKGRSRLDSLASFIEGGKDPMAHLCYMLWLTLSRGYKMGKYILTAETVCHFNMIYGVQLAYDGFVGKPAEPEKAPLLLLPAPPTTTEPPSGGSVVEEPKQASIKWSYSYNDQMVDALTGSIIYSDQEYGTCPKCKCHFSNESIRWIGWTNEGKCPSCQGQIIEDPIHFKKGRFKLATSCGLKEVSGYIVTGGPYEFGLHKNQEGMWSATCLKTGYALSEQEEKRRETASLVFYNKPVEDYLLGLLRSKQVESINVSKGDIDHVFTMMDKDDIIVKTSASEQMMDGNEAKSFIGRLIMEFGYEFQICLPSLPS